MVGWWTSHSTSALRSSQSATPQRGEVGDEVDVAVAEVPAGELVAGHRLHLEVGGEQVVAAVGAVGGHVLEEEVGREALAAQPAVVVGEAGDDRVDLAGRGASRSSSSRDSIPLGRSAIGARYRRARRRVPG